MHTGKYFSCTFLTVLNWDTGESKLFIKFFSSLLVVILFSTFNERGVLSVLGNYEQYIHI